MQVVECHFCLGFIVYEIQRDFAGKNADDALINRPDKKTKRRLSRAQISDTRRFDVPFGTPKCIINDVASLA